LAQISNDFLSFMSLTIETETLPYLRVHYLKPDLWRVAPISTRARGWFEGLPDLTKRCQRRSKQMFAGGNKLTLAARSQGLRM
jgi:hypothetical protein